MNLDGIHRTSPVRQNDPRASKRTRGPAPPPPPRWSAWLIALGILLTVFLLFRPIMPGGAITRLPYSQFVDRVTSDQVKTATISASGLVTGGLKTGGNYESQLPVALPNDQLAQLLLDHHVQ